MNWSRVAILVLILYGFYHGYQTKEVHRPDGVLVSETPLQTLDISPRPAVAHGKAILQPLATYHIRARVISTERYWLGERADLSPIDFCLGWNKLSDNRVLKDLRFSQSGRFCFYSYQTLPLDLAELNISMANTHLIPADSQIKSQLMKVRVGDLIELDGDLVRVDFKDGSEWKSSLSRSDTGDGACEVMYVKSVRVD